MNNNIEYWLEVTECVCKSEHPIGACLRCDLEAIQREIEQLERQLDRAIAEVLYHSNGRCVFVKKEEMKSKKRWMSDRDKCDLCGADISPDKVEYFVDGKVARCGPWALKCPTCFERLKKELGIGLGLGIGQKYSGDKSAVLLEDDHSPNSGWEY